MWDGLEIVTSDHTGTLEAWAACPACGDAEALLELAATRVTRGFTTRERVEFVSGL